MKLNTIAMNKELTVTKYATGIKVLARHKTSDNDISVNDLLQLPFPVYFEDHDHITRQCNDICADECGFDTITDCIGTEWFKPFKKHTVVNTIKNDLTVVANKQCIIVEEMAMREDSTNVHTLSLRMPWYDSKNNVIGLFGCSILLDKNNLSESLSLIKSRGLLNHASSTFKTTELHRQRLSMRETDCLKYTLRGYSARKVATALKISQRTVEEYLNNIKRKLGATSKAELIDMTIDSLNDL